MNSNRYIRQTTLKEFGPEAQQKLGKARVLVVGVGGLGIPVLQYLNAMGVGTLGMVEQDVVELDNLQRQVLYSENDIGKSKIHVALDKLKAQNSSTLFIVHDAFLIPANALEIIEGYDIVVDASDNFAARYLVNDACVILKKPFVYGALHGFEGQLSVFHYQGGPTYRCLFSEMPSTNEIPSCNDNGVLGVLPGIVGSLQALETVKIITQIGEVLSGKLLLFNGLDQSIRKMNFNLQPQNLNIQHLQDSYETTYCTTAAEIAVEDFQSLLDSDPTLQIVDVRTPEEYKKDHIAPSQNIPFNQLDNRSREINLERPVYFLCQSGKRSRAACELLWGKFPGSSLYSIAGGLNSYRTLCF